MAGAQPRGGNAGSAYNLLLQVAGTAASLRSGALSRASTAVGGKTSAAPTGARHAPCCSRTGAWRMLLNRAMAKRQASCRPPTLNIAQRRHQADRARTPRVRQERGRRGGDGEERRTSSSCISTSRGEASAAAVVSGGALAHERAVTGPEFSSTLQQKGSTSSGVSSVASWGARNSLSASCRAPWRCVIVRLRCASMSRTEAQSRFRAAVRRRGGSQARPVWWCTQRTSCRGHLVDLAL